MVFYVLEQNVTSDTAAMDSEHVSWEEREYSKKIFVFKPH